jgi:hypothetical protein
MYCSGGHAATSPKEAERCMFVERLQVRWMQPVRRLASYRWYQHSSQQFQLSCSDSNSHHSHATQVFIAIASCWPQERYTFFKQYPSRSSTPRQQTPPLSSAMAASSDTETTRYKLVFFTPLQSLSEIKTAIFAAGAGTHSGYSEVCFATPGIGQFKPGNSATPAVGAKGKLEEVEEVRCETICNGREVAKLAVAALKK